MGNVTYLSLKHLLAQGKRMHVCVLTYKKGGAGGGGGVNNDEATELRTTAALRITFLQK